MTFSDDDGGSGAWSDQVGIDAAEVLPGPSASNGNSQTNAPTPESQQTSPSELRTPTESSDAVRKRDTELRPPRLGLIIPVSPTSLHEELFQHSPLLFSPISTSASALPLDLHLSGTGHRRAWSATDLERRSSESTAPFSSRSRSILSAGGSLFTEPDGVASESSQRLVKLRRGAANNRAPRGARTPNPNPNPNQRRYQSQGTDTADLVIAGDPPPELASELEVIRTYSDAVVQTVKAVVRNSDAMRINLELEAEVDRLRRRVVVLEGELRKASASSSSTSRRSSRSDSNPNPSRREDRAREAQHTRTHSASASAPRSFLVKAASTDRQVPPTVPFSFNFRNLSGSFMSGGQATTIATGNGRSTSRSSS
ncbi:hypothetical protein C8F01DRAFT_1087117 [Mycena amicta]|nr:hypothetical protein C8F01DRAFT_1087117 [Mycena amicta]